MVDSNDWGTESGLTENYVLTVEDAYFTTDARYNSGESLLLKWKGHAVDADSGEPVLFGRDEDEEEVEVSFPVGKNWDTNDGGKTAESSAGRGKFNQNSRYGKVINRSLAKKGDGGFDIGHILQDRGRPQQADVWKGLKFLMKYEETNYGGDIGVKSALMPVKFMGEADGAAGGSSATPAATGETTGAAASSSNKALVARLTKLAKESESHSAFVDKALDIEGVADDSDLLESVVEETKFYSEARA